MDKPVIPNRDGASRYTVDVTNDDYIQLVRMYPENSVRVSLRRLLYWFVENEMYDFLDWEVISDYKDENTVQFERLLVRARQTTEKLQKYAPIEHRDSIENMLMIIKSMEK